MKRILKTGVYLAMALTSTSACAQIDSSDQPPAIAAPQNAEPVVVILDLEARDPDAFKAHLLEVIPVTRQAAGARYSWSTQDPENPAAFTLVQGWDSVEQQQGYITWRADRGDMAEFRDMLVSDPDILVRRIFDR